MSLLLKLLHVVTLAAMIALEQWPNKYLANGFVLIKTLVGLQAVTAFAAWMTFKTKLPSPSTVNWALTLTKDEPTRWQNFGRWVNRSIAICCVLVALLVGQWYVLFCYVVFLTFLYRVKPAAREYLKGMTIDTTKKAVTIDV